METVNLCAVPFLERLTVSSWSKFVSEFEAYKARDGRRAARDLISVVVLKLICLRLRISVGDVRELDDHDFMCRVSALFAPSTPLESYDRFRKIYMVGRVASIDNLMSYILAYERQAILCEEKLPDDKKLRKLFVSGLKPIRLSERVAFAEPKSLEDAKRIALDEVERMMQMSKEVSLASDDESYAGRGAPRGRSGPRSYVKQQNFKPAGAPGEAARPAPGQGPPPRPEVAHSSGIRCFDCGEPGVKRGHPGCKKRVAATVAVPSSGSNRLWAGAGRDQQGRLVSTRPSERPPARSQLNIVTPAQLSEGEPEPIGELKLVEQGDVSNHVPDTVLPRIQVEVQGDIMSSEMFIATALLDSGATASFMSPDLYEKLRQSGVSATPMRHKYRTAGSTTVETQMEVNCIARITPDLCPRAQRVVEVPIQCGVLNTGEDLLVGYPHLHDSGLLDLLVSGISPSLEEEETTDDLSEDDEGPEGSMADFPLPYVPEGPEYEPVRKVVEEFAEVFGPLHPEGALVEPIPILLKDGVGPKPVPPRRLSPVISKVVQDQVDEWRELGIVQPSNSPYCAPVVVVRKKDAGYRVCIDYRALNMCTIDMKYPMKNVKEVLAQLAGKKVFGKLDLRAGFNQVPLTEEAKPLTAFAHPKGLDQFNFLPFGVKNGPSMFQQRVDRALNGLTGQVCEAFVDDILNYGTDIADYAAGLRMILERCREVRLRLKGKKCELGLTEIDVLGHRANAEGIMLTPERKQGILAVQPPRSTTQLRSFVGLANYFRTFVPGFATIAAPLHRLSSKKVAFVWTEGAQKAYTDIKNAILNAPLLHHIDYSQPVILRTDASTGGVGGVLLHPPLNQGEPDRCICFVSRAFNTRESKWSTMEQEAFAVFFCITQLRSYLMGYSFVVETDHRNLQYLNKATAPKVIRWRLRLQEYDFSIRHIPGRTNVLADAMSRCLIVKGERDDELNLVHNGIVGHRGMRMCERLLRQMGKEWPKMRDDIANYIKKCPTCQKTRLGQGSVAAALATTEASEPFEVLAMDTMGPLPEDEDGCKYLIACIDCFTRYVELFATKTVGAHDAARAILQIVGRYGCPREIRSDGGSQYAANVVEQLLANLGIGHHFSLPYRPQSNGIVERVNAEIGRHLRALVMDLRVVGKWSAVLPLVQRILNCTPHTAIGTTPARLMHGGTVTLDRGILNPFPESSEICVEEFIQQMGNAQRELIERSSKFQEKHVASRIRKAGVTKMSEFLCGDYVLVSYPSRAPSKLAPRWRGPLVVVEKLGDHTYSCQDLVTLRISPFHIERLKIYDTSATEDPVQIAAVDSDEYHVECIVDHRKGRRKRDWSFRVRWVGYEPTDDSWLPYANVKSCEALDVYLAQHPELRL